MKVVELNFFPTTTPGTLFRSKTGTVESSFFTSATVMTLSLHNETRQ
jgi:hypothetical protein